jgi:hypothetical protein
MRVDPRHGPGLARQRTEINEHTVARGGDVLIGLDHCARAFTRETRRTQRIGSATENWGPAQAQRTGIVEGGRSHSLRTGTRARTTGERGSRLLIVRLNGQRPDRRCENRDRSRRGGRGRSGVLLYGRLHERSGSGSVASKQLSVALDAVNAVSEVETERTCAHVRVNQHSNTAGQRNHGRWVSRGWRRDARARGTGTVPRAGKFCSLCSHVNPPSLLFRRMFISLGLEEPQCASTHDTGPTSRDSERKLTSTPLPVGEMF